jgi:hypothetical protein
VPRSLAAAALPPGGWIAPSTAAVAQKQPAMLPHLASVLQWREPYLACTQSAQSDVLFMVLIDDDQFGRDAHRCG